MGKKIPSSQEGTGQLSTDSSSDGLVRSAHRSPTDTPGVPFDAAKVRKDAETLVAEEEKSEKNLLLVGMVRCTGMGMVCRKGICGKARPLMRMITKPQYNSADVRKQLKDAAKVVRKIEKANNRL